MPANKKPSIGGWHVFHVIMTVMTSGYWAPVWAAHVIIGGRAVPVEVDSDQALLADPEFVESLAQMRRSEGRVVRRRSVEEY